MEIPIYTMKNNIESALNILEAIRIIKEFDKDYNPLIHICSSSEFYGKVDRKDLPITEEHKANPGNVYGVSKTAGDFLAQIYAQYYDLRILITRMFTHTSERRTMLSAEHFYAKVIAEIEAGKRDKVIPIGNLKSIRTWRNAKEAVIDYYNLFKLQKTGIYNVAGDTIKSIGEVLDYMLSISKLNKEEIKLIEDPSLMRKIDVDMQTVDCSKFKQDIEQNHNYTF